MTGMITALGQWLSQFGTWYAENDVPDDAVLPYGTVPLKDTEWDQPTTFYLQWYARTNDSTSLVAKVDQIAAAIGTQGAIIKYGNGTDTGFLWIRAETPFSQILIDGDIRRAYINLSIKSYHMPGV